MNSVRKSCIACRSFCLPFLTRGVTVKVLQVLSAFVFIFSTTIASVRPYISGLVGTGAMMNTDVISPGMTLSDYVTYKKGFPRIGAIGVISDYRRFEVVLIQQLNEVDTVKYDGIHATSVSGRNVSITSLMVNAYRDFPQKSGFSWYLTGGIGSSEVTINSPGTVTKGKVFTYQAGAGMGIKLSRHLVVDCGYRYIRPSHLPLYGAEFTYASHNVMVGSRFSF